MFVWVPVNRDKVVKVQEPLPNCLIKLQQEVDSWSIFHIFYICYKNVKVLTNIIQYYSINETTQKTGLTSPVEYISFVY